jgi:ABC-2 type transport system permease protein
MFATSIVSTIQAITFLLIAKFYGVDISYLAIVVTIPIIIISSIILNAFALFISSVIKQLENFATVMNFVIFPMFFLSSALYPLWKIKDSSILLYEISSYNPFTYIVESIRFSLYLKVDVQALLVLVISLVITLIMAFLGFKSKKVNNS